MIFTRNILKNKESENGDDSDDTFGTFLGGYNEVSCNYFDNI
jgi:hypothetical protein